MLQPTKFKFVINRATARALGQAGRMHSHAAAEVIASIGLSTAAPVCAYPLTR